MARKVIEEMDTIFQILQDHIDSDDKCRIIPQKRHIIAEGEEKNVVEFVKRAGIYTFQYLDFSGAIYEYNNQYYLLVKENYSDIIDELGLDVLDIEIHDGVIPADYEIVQGCQMLAIVDGVLNIKNNTTSIQLIDQCFGCEEDKFLFRELYDEFFEESAVYKLDMSRFDMSFEEDCCRIAAYSMAGKQYYFSASTVTNLHDLVLLKSSRSVSATLINSIGSSLPEYSFFQLYQCLEYLFKLNNAFDISTKFSLKHDVAIGLACEYEFKISERDNLKGIIRKYAKEPEVDYFIMMSGLTVCPDATLPQKQEFISDYIYNTRCSIAHLRYGKEKEFEGINWENVIEALVKVILCVYQNIDTDIISTCSSKGSWHDIQYSTK